MDVPQDLKDSPPRVDRAPGARRVRRIAPLAAAIGVIIAATVGLLLERINVPVPSQPTVPTISTTVPTR